MKTIGVENTWRAYMKYSREASCDRVDPDNSNRLVLFACNVHGSQDLFSQLFPGYSQIGIAYRMLVEVYDGYEWKRDLDSSSVQDQKDTGLVTTLFHPSRPMAGKWQLCPGDEQLECPLLDEIKMDQVKLNDRHGQKVSFAADLQDDGWVKDNFVYSNDPAHKVAGDLRVSFYYANPGTVTVMAKQLSSNDGRLGMWMLTTPKLKMFNIQPNRLSRSQFVASIEGDVYVWTWYVRILCWILVFAGIWVIATPRFGALFVFGQKVGQESTACNQCLMCSICVLLSVFIVVSTAASCWAYHYDRKISIPLFGLALTAFCMALLVRMRCASRVRMDDEVPLLPEKQPVKPIY